MKLLIAALLVATPAVAADPMPKASAPQQQNGRFVIVFSPFVRADTFLVDSQTGRVWKQTQYTDLEDDPSAWRLIPQVNGPADIQALILSHPLKQTPNTKPPQ